MYQCRISADFSGLADFDSLFSSHIFSFFPKNFLVPQHVCVNNICLKFQIHKLNIKKKKNFTNVSRCDKEFIVAKVDTLSWSEISFQFRH